MPPCTECDEEKKPENQMTDTEGTANREKKLLNLIVDLVNSLYGIILNICHIFKKKRKEDLKISY